MNRANIIFGILAILISCFVFYELRSFPEAPPGEIGADYFPRLIAISLAITGIILIAVSFLKKTTENIEAISFKDKAFKRAVFSFVMTVVYCFAIEFAGFVVSSILFLMALMFMLNERGFIKMALISSAISGGIYLIFSELLFIDLPLGTLYGY